MSTVSWLSKNQQVHYGTLDTMGVILKNRCHIWCFSISNFRGRRWQKIWPNLPTLGQSTSKVRKKNPLSKIPGFDDFFLAQARHPCSSEMLWRLHTQLIKPIPRKTNEATPVLWTKFWHDIFRINQKTTKTIQKTNEFHKFRPILLAVPFFGMANIADLKMCKMVLRCRSRKVKNHSLEPQKQPRLTSVAMLNVVEWGMIRELFHLKNTSLRHAIFCKWWYWFWNDSPTMQLTWDLEPIRTLK